jgi:hypothetical protein
LLLAGLLDGIRESTISFHIFFPSKKSLQVREMCAGMLKKLEKIPLFTGATLRQ